VNRTAGSRPADKVVVSGAARAGHGRGADGSPKILDEWPLPLTGRACVHRVITNLGVIDVTDNGLVLVETAPGVTHHDITAATPRNCTPPLEAGQRRPRLRNPP
jgi:acyl CoA:acetate/3-ketoacid CoA transferase beta subunit